MIPATKVRWMGYGLAVAGVLGCGLRAQTAASTSAGSADKEWVPVAMSATAPAVTKFFPLSEVKRGMKGVAYTVFEGVNPEPMQVEILGILKDALGPGQDMILARLHGEKPEYTGVVAGMSGSPVYIDGRLVGALSYRIGQFSKEPIAGITPIESMLQVRDGDEETQNDLQRKANARILSSGRNEGVSSDGNSFAPLRENASLPELRRGQPEMRAIETPLVFGGFSQQTVD
ncbi:MAG: SpoIVB peptidase S55 domain-containing protein, partial [Edaphobacter sp.]